eukprot:gene3563-4069_t
MSGTRRKTHGSKHDEQRLDEDNCNMESEDGEELARVDSTVNIIKPEPARRINIILLCIVCGVLLFTTITFCSLYAVARASNQAATVAAKMTGNSVCCKGLQSPPSPWSYTCANGRCLKVSGTPKTRAQQFSSCKMSCGEFGGLWPKPRTKSVIGNKTIAILPYNIVLKSIACKGTKCTGAVKVGGRSVESMIKAAFSYFVNTTQKMCLPLAVLDPSSCTKESQSGRVVVTVTVKSQDTSLKLSTSEAYTLKINSKTNEVFADINADTFFGARHGLETLSQLISYDEVGDALQIVSYADIVDSPAFPFRGLMLDTSRNFYSVKSILRQLDAMSYNKLNTFHWHITDTHSFPIFINDQPQMSLLGAYSQRQVYSLDDVTKITEYARLRGIRVLPEFDQPAHAGNGWQWGPSAGKGDLAFCVNRRPWQSYCVEPPCGQLNPLNNNTYDVLGKIYKDYLSRFSPDLFHFGGDEVDINCWNTTAEVIKWMQAHGKSRNKDDFMDLWNLFLVRAAKKFKSLDKDMPLILWSSHMTDPGYLEKYLDNKTYIIHLWNKADSKATANILNKGFKVIFSNYDHVYLDCGFGGWVSDGNNWCSPYKEWQLFYNLNPRKFMTNLKVPLSRLADQVLGGEANMWSEQVDENSAEMKIWPRVAGLAERLWADPVTPWIDADSRIIHQRHRLVERGINADALKPQWCYQNSGYCRS